MHADSITVDISRWPNLNLKTAQVCVHTDTHSHGGAITKQLFSTTFLWINPASTCDGWSHPPTAERVWSEADFYCVNASKLAKGQF